MNAPSTPIVSVVVEGYNEYLAQDEIDAWEGLKAQRYPRDRIEVVLVGSVAQARRWSERFAHESPFLRVKTVGVDDPWYFSLKNEGVRVASGDIIALADSDVMPDPGWLGAIVDGIGRGADVVVGVSLFRTAGRRADDALMQVAAAISWVALLGTSLRGGEDVARFQAHNVGFRAAVARAHPFRTDLRHRVAGVFLPAALRASGARLRLQPDQRVAHSFHRAWWLRLHARFGWEVYLLRREHADWPHRWVRHTWILEPVLTAAWHALLDGKRWLAFGGLVGAGPARRVALFPLLLGLSAVARGAEMLGMYATMVAPERMKRFAASV